MLSNMELELRNKRSASKSTKHMLSNMGLDLRNKMSA